MKILILTCNTGQGHNSAANSLAEEFARRGIACETTDALSLVHKKLSDFISSWHVRLYRYAPVLFDFGYGFTEKHPSLLSEHSAMYSLFKLGVDKLEALVESGGFTCVICTHVFSGMMVTELRKRRKIRAGFVATDYTCYPGVRECEVDVFFLPHESLRDEYLACGVPEEKMLASGIPVKRMFYGRKTRAEARRALGLKEDGRHLLMMCGSMGCGPMEGLARALAARLPEDAEMTVVCGTNEKLKKKLDGLEGPRVHVLGYTDRVSDLMDASDLYLTKPGGLSTTEAANKRLPMAFIDAVSGCESYNRFFFLSRGMALASNDQDRLPELCLKRLYDSEKLSLQRARMEADFTAYSAGVICDYFEKEPKE